ncbi:MAG: tryptophan--tRNA ligase [Candidimonas sp.]
MTINQDFRQMRIVSGIQPSGIIHLGNYLGAIRQWVSMQSIDAQRYYFVADLHALTTSPDQIQLRNSVKSTYAMLMACGISLKKSTLFVQSHVPHHTELSWVLTTISRTGWMNRMTQFKDKASIGKIVEQIKDENFSSLEMRVNSIIEHLDQHMESVGLGLFTYPVLMAADILLYQATHVPVGDDQRQHLQLTRQVVRSFNHKYGHFFQEPQEITTSSPRIMSLRNPTSKMSKSAVSDEERINLTDSDDEIVKKIKRATTDSDLLPSSADQLGDRHGARNLLTIYASLADLTLEETCESFGGKGFGHLKKDLTDLVVSHIGPIRDRYFRLITEDPTFIDSVINKHSVDPIDNASKTMTIVRKMVGLR